MSIEFIDSDTESFIEHHGVKGMKWGIRKDRGRKNSRKTSTQPNPNLGEAKVRRGVKGKALKSMSDQDLNRSNDRLRREAEYRRLNSAGQSFVKDVLKQSAKPVLVAALTGTGVMVTKKLLSTGGPGVANAAKDVAKRGAPAVKEMLKSIDNSEWATLVVQAWKKKK